MILTLDKVSKHFGGLKAVEHCSFQVERGKITAIIGPNGSGKSTVFHLISRILSQDRGNIHFDGQDVNTLREHEVARLGIARTFQEVRLFHNLTIQDHMEIALSNTDERLVRSIRDGHIDNTKKIGDVLDLVGLDKPLDTLATDLSYGQRKLLDLAVAIAKPHKLLMLDEPVAGVNPGLRKQIKDVLRELNRQGETILVIEHDMHFVMGVAGHVIVLDEGSVLVEGPPQEIQNNKRVLDAYLGE